MNAEMLTSSATHPIWSEEFLAHFIHLQRMIDEWAPGGSTFAMMLVREKQIPEMEQTVTEIERIIMQHGSVPRGAKTRIRELRQAIRAFNDIMEDNPAGNPIPVARATEALLNTLVKGYGNYPAETFRCENKFFHWKDGSS